MSIEDRIRQTSDVIGRSSSLRAAMSMVGGTTNISPMRSKRRMRLTARKCASDMPTWRAASAGFSVRGATHAVQLANVPLCCARPRTRAPGCTASCSQLEATPIGSRLTVMR